jgi:hypothetical protein
MSFIPDDRLDEFGYIRHPHSYLRYNIYIPKNKKLIKSVDGSTDYIFYKNRWIVLGNKLHKKYWLTAEEYIKLFCKREKIIINNREKFIYVYALV